MLYFLNFFLLTLLPFNPGENQDSPVTIEGVTMGTTYHIIYFDGERKRNFKGEVDSLLVTVNKAINTYDSTSEISVFNASRTGIDFRLPYLPKILKKAEEIYKTSGGAFDPTVMPLVNAWGFGPGKSLRSLSERKVDSLRELVGFEKIQLSEKGVRKDDPRVQLDLGGIGQGFGVDVVFEYLRSKGIRNMLVELGGEGMGLGKNLQKNKPWRIGITNPNSTPDNQFFKAYVTLDEKAFTTSGNYFNYRIIQGRKYGHTIDPVKGYPVQHSLLSASVFATDCATADGWATAFMVLGVEKAIDKLKSLSDVEALLIYSDENGKLKTYVTPGIEKQTVLEP